MARTAVARYRNIGLRRRFGEAVEVLLAWLSGTPRARVSPKAHLDPALDKEAAYRQIAFTFAVIALSAKLARCDGTLTRDAFLAFRKAFPLEDDESAKIRELFRLAWEDTSDAEAVARQVVYLYPNQRDLWNEMLSLLSAVARADGPLTAEELRMLTSVGAVFGYTRAQMGRLIAAAADPRAADPFRVLGLKRGARRDEVKARYRSLMRRYHPDAVAATLHYPEAIAVAQQRSAMISEAYRKLAKG